MNSGRLRCASAALLIAAITILFASQSDAARNRGRTGCSSLSVDETLQRCSAIIASGIKGPLLANAYVNRCWAYNEKRQFDAAIDDCDAGLRLTNRDAALYNNRGYAYLNKGWYDRAILDFDQSLRIDPKNAHAHAGRADAWYSKNDYDKAIAEYDQAVRLKPDYSHAYNRRGNVWYAKRNYDKAIADYDLAIRVTPENPFFFNNRANALKAKNDLERALIDYNQALRLNNKNAMTYRNRGDLFAAREDYDRAIADYDQALRIDPEFVGAYFDRASAWFVKNEFSRAIADYDEVLRRAPTHANAIGSRGAALVIQGDLDGAIAASNRSLELDATNAAAYNNRGTALRQKREFDRAMADLDRAIELSPKAARFRHNRGLVWLDKGDTRRAIADFDEAIKLEPDFPAAAAQRGVAYERSGDSERARADFRSAIAMKPRYYDAQRNMDLARERLAALDRTPPRDPPLPQTSAVEVASVGSAPAAQPARLERRVALVIGNAAYKNVAALPNPGRDADAFAKVLRSIGFAAVTLEQDMSREKLLEALRSFAHAAEGAEWAIIYYAGHGIEIGGVNYLVPIDGRLEVDRDVQFEAIPLDQVMASVEGAKKLRLVVLDACRDNPFTKRIKRTIASRSIGRGLARIEPEGGTLVVYAAKHGEVALDGEGMNSPFMTALVRRLPTPGMEISKLFRVVRDDVMTATNRRQEPFIYGSLPGDDFFFVTAK